MNKLFKKIAAIGLGMVAAIGVGVGLTSTDNTTPVEAAAGEVFYTLTPAKGSNSNYASSCDIAIGGITWNLGGNSQMIPWRIGGKNITNQDRALYSKTAMTAPISKIDLELGAGNITVNSFKLIVASNAAFTTIIDTVPVTYKASATTTIVPSSTATWAANSYYKFVFNVTNASGSNKYVLFTSAKFYEGEAEVGAATVESVSLTNNGYQTSFTTDDSWPTTGLDAVVTMSDSSDYEGEIIYTFNPATPSLFYSSNATSLSITAKAQGVSSNTVTINGITVTPANGSQWDPYTVSEAYEILSGLAAGANNGKEVFVTGTVVVDSNYKQGSHGATFTITDGVKSILAYNINDTSITPGASGYVGHGYRVTVGGALKNYNGTYEICYEAGVANASILSITEPEFGILSSIEVEELPRTSFEVGETFTSEGLVINTIDTFDVELLVTEGFTTDYDGYTFEESDAGTVTVTVSYTLGEVTATTTYDIEVFVPKYTKVTDVIDQTFTGITGTTYTSWSNKKGTSGIAYTGNNAGSYESVQLRSDNSKASAGIISTTSVGTILKVEVVWQEKTAAGRTLNIYGSNTAYSATDDLYNTSKDGDLLGTIVCGTSTSFIIEGDYQYIGLRSASGAMYLTSISITWALPKLDTESLNAFSQLILDSTNTICADGGTENNGAELEGAWDAVIDAFEALNAPTKEAFVNAEANTTGTVVEQAAARYDYIVAKYSNCFDVAERNPVSAFNRNLVSPIANVDATTIIAISTLVVLGFASLVIIKRRRTLSK